MSITLYSNIYRKPLLPGRIRLLRILPHEDDKARIRCELFQYSLQDSGRRSDPYDALSYVWGDPAEIRSISVREPNSTTEHNICVTENLYGVLSRLRYRNFERIVWVDALCINQKDEREKEKQIQSMANIYGQASCVVVWLGQSANDSEKAIQDIRNAGGQKLNSGLSHEAIIALLRRLWFRRIWV